MKFRLPKKQLTRILDKTSMAIPSRSTSSILMGILVEIDENGTMKVTGSDNEIRIEQTLQLSDYEAGRVVLPGKLFVDIIRSMPDEEITITCEEDLIASVSTSRSSFRIACLAADEYPLSDQYIEDKTIQIRKDTFIDMIAKTTFAASKTDSRGVIIGALLDVSEKGLTMVALDGFRMSVIQSELDGSIEYSSKIIIAARILNEIVKLIADFEEDVIEIGFNESKRNARILTDQTKITISLINGTFLNYENILPSSFTARATIDKNALRQSVDRASLMSTDGRNNLVKLKFTQDELRISAKSDSGHLNDAIPITLDGSDIEIGFNAKYLLDGLKAIETDNITFNLDTSIRPCTIEPENGSYIYMILPVRIS